MAYDPQQHHRRTIRLRSYDYRRPGAYFVTICTVGKACLFGEITGGVMYPNTCGHIVMEEWLRTADLRPYATLDVFVVMPNHVHGIIGIVDINHDRRDTARRVPTVRQFARPVACSLPTIVGAFKSAVTRRINAMRGAPGARVWQGGYYEHIVRDERDLARIRRYIGENPMRWHLNQHRRRH